MSPRQKAAELVDRLSAFQPMNQDVKIPYDNFKASIKSALILVDEILEYLTADGFPLEIKFWESVKTELNQLKTT